MILWEYFRNKGKGLISFAESESTLSETKIKEIFKKATEKISKSAINVIKERKGREEELYPLYVREFLNRGFQVTVQGGFYKELVELQPDEKYPDFRVDLVIAENGNLTGIEVKGPSIDRGWSIEGKEVKKDKEKLKKLLNLGYIHRGFFVGILFNKETNEFEVYVKEITKS